MNTIPTSTLSPISRHFSHSDVSILIEDDDDDQTITPAFLDQSPAHSSTPTSIRRGKDGGGGGYNRRAGAKAAPPLARPWIDRDRGLFWLSDNVACPLRGDDANGDDDDGGDSGRDGSKSESNGVSPTDSL